METDFLVWRGKSLLLKKYIFAVKDVPVMSCSESAIPVFQDCPNHWSV